MAAVRHPRLDPEDWESLYDEHGPSLPVELIDGQAVVVVSPQDRWHDAALWTLRRAFEAWSDTQPEPWYFVADNFVRPGPHRIAPDIAGWRPERRPAPGRRLLLDAPLPDLAVEILSLDSAENDLGPKRRAYVEQGIECWVVDPGEGWVLVDDGRRERTFRGTDTLTSPLLPGFALAVATLRGER